MISSLSNSNRHSPIETQQLFQNSRVKAEKEGRVSSSNLTHLMKAVKRTNEDLSLSAYREIKGHVLKLEDILSSTNSKLYVQKNAKITEALNMAEQRLSPNAVSERIKESKSNYTLDINDALSTIKNNIPTLEKKAMSAQNRVHNTVAKLPAGKSQSEARRLIASGSITAFNKNSAITQGLFPSRTEQVETRDGYRERDVEHPDKGLWTSLESKSMKMLETKQVLSEANIYINRRDNFSFTEPSNKGKIELSNHQKALLNFAEDLK